VVALNDGSQQLVQIGGDEVPALTGLVAGQEAGEEALRGDYVDLVDGLQNQVKYALLLE